MEPSIHEDFAQFAASAIGNRGEISMVADPQDETVVTDVLNRARASSNAFRDSNGRKRHTPTKKTEPTPKDTFVENGRRKEERPKNRPGRPPRKSDQNAVPDESKSAGRERPRRRRTVESDHEEGPDYLSIVEQLRRDKKKEKRLLDQEKALAADQEIDLTIVRAGTLRLVDWIRFHRIYHAGGIQIRYKKVCRSKNSEAGYILILTSSSVDQSEDGCIDIQSINGECPDIVKKLLEPHILPPRRATNQHRFVLLQCNGKRWELVDWHIVTMRNEKSSSPPPVETVLNVPNKKRRTMRTQEDQLDSPTTTSEVRSGSEAPTHSQDQRDAVPKRRTCGVKVIPYSTSRSRRETRAPRHRSISTDSSNHTPSSARFTAVGDPKEGHRRHLGISVQANSGSRHQKSIDDRHQVSTIDKGKGSTDPTPRGTRPVSNTSRSLFATAVQPLMSVHSDGAPPTFFDGQLTARTNNEPQMAHVRRLKKRIFFPRPVSVEIVSVKLTDSPTEKPGLRLNFRAERGPNKPFCPEKAIINLPLENRDDQYFMVAMDSLPDAGVLCPGTDEAKIPLEEMEVLSYKANEGKRSFLRLPEFGEEFTTLKETCKMYCQASLPRHVFIGPFSAHLTATSQYMIPIKPLSGPNGDAENMHQEEVDRKPTILPVLPTRKLITSLRFNSSLNIELFSEEVVRVRIPFFNKKFVGPLYAFKEWLSALTAKMNSGIFESGDSSKESLVEISSDEEEEPFIKPEPLQEKNEKSAQDESASRNYPINEEVAKISWLSEAMPIYGQKWIGVRHPFRHEKYNLFRSETGARKWAENLVETVRSGQAIRCVFPDETATTNNVNPQHSLPGPLLKSEAQDGDQSDGGISY